MDVKEPQKAKRKLNWSLITALVVIVSLLGVFVIRPGIIGYSIYQQVKESNSDLVTFTGNVNQLQDQLTSIKTNLSQYSISNEELQQQLLDASREIKICLADKDTLTTSSEKEKLDAQNTIETLRQQIQQQQDDVEKQLKNKDLQLEDELTKKDTEVAALLAEKDQEAEELNANCLSNLSNIQDQLSTLQKNWDELAFNAARNICCKQKVDNPNINYYTVANNKINCLESGENKLNCFS
ncbi:hypothetical protein J4420_01405 [Candidatus Woesearchaeota archaeon]|nr:hypothetical protein [Candidatus Woesearchaeota archaeon]